LWGNLAQLITGGTTTAFLVVLSALSSIPDLDYFADPDSF
jgi:hypothetical protein